MYPLLDEQQLELHLHGSSLTCHRKMTSFVRLHGHYDLVVKILLNRLVCYAWGSTLPSDLKNLECDHDRTASQGQVQLKGVEVVEVKEPRNTASCALAAVLFEIGVSNLDIWQAACKRRRTHESQPQGVNLE